MLDAQLPVPAPAEGQGDRLWARARVALRDKEDIRRLTDFLNAVYSRMTQPDNAKYVEDNARYVVMVQAVPAVAPRIIAEPQRGQVADDANMDTAPVPNGDLDVVNVGAIAGESANARTWRLVAVCADARSNIEIDIIQDLAQKRPRFRLAGLTYALLHGTAVMVLLAHEPQDGHRAHGAPAEHQPRQQHPSRAANLEEQLRLEEQLGRKLEKELREEPRWTKLRVMVYQELTRDQLEPEGRRNPMLGLGFRWQDRPGALLDVLTSVGKTLSNTLSEESHAAQPVDPSEAVGLSEPYARLQVATGRVARGNLTIRIHASAQQVADWKVTDWNSKMEEIGRKVRTLAVLETTQRASDPPGDDLHTPEEPVVRISRICEMPPSK